MKYQLNILKKYFLIGFILLVLFIGLLIYYFKSNKKQIEIFSDTQDLIVPGWTKLGGDIDGETSSDYSGKSVSLSSDGSIVAIGAYYNDDNGDNSGHVRVYQYDGSSWIQLGGDIDGEDTGDESGWSVSLSSDGKIVAIGAIYNDGNGTDSGHVRVYQYDGSSWIQLGGDIDGEDTGDYSGNSVSLSSDGSIVAIGAKYNDGNGNSSGHVRVYEYNGSSWIQLGQDINGEASDDRSGWSVSLSSDGKIVAIGAYGNDDNGSSSGHVRVYQYNGSQWTKLGGDIDGEAAFDYSGWSVSLSSDGKIIAIGAIYNDGNDSNSGHVRVYQYDGSSWTRLGGDIDGEVSGDYSGWAVSLSSDGTIISIGAIANDGNGADSGHVRVYQYNGSQWTQLGENIDGEAAFDHSGYSVSLSSDGNIVAIGAMYGNGDSSGHVRVYKYAQPSTTQPSTTQPSTTQPSTTQPSTTQPSTTQPSTTQPSTTQPSTTQPSTTQPSTTHPSTTQPSITQPTTTQPTTTTQKVKKINEILDDFKEPETKKSKNNFINIDKFNNLQISNSYELFKN